MSEISFGPLLATFRASLGLVSQDLEFRLDGVKIYDRVLLLSLLQINEISFSNKIQKRPSIRSVSDGIGLPYETARRRLIRLAKNGVVSIDQFGCHISRFSPIYSDYVKNLSASATAAHCLISRVEPLGIVARAGCPIAQSEIWVNNEKQVGHLAFEHTLRTLTSVQSLCSNLLTTIVFMKVLGINTNRIPDSAIIDLTPEDFAYLSSRGMLQPAKSMQLARHIGLTRATIGRYIQKGVQSGLYKCASNGLLINYSILASETGIDVMARTRASLVRLFNDLRRLTRNHVS